MENNRNILNDQNPHWERTFSDNEDMFGQSPSEAAIKAVKIFKDQGKIKILELGGGQGRDTIYFAQNGFQVYVLDYTNNGIEAINKRAHQLGLSNSITAIQHDIRNPLPFDDEFFEGCYSHMLYCMALSTQELEFLSQEVRRVLKTDGINIYTARNTNDSHFGTGIHRGENMYEVGGFIVHFFTKEMIAKLAKGYTILEISEFEEGQLPRKLYQVTLQKQNCC
ncbi:class I SAM-dependent methyltransferase [Clostridium sp. P21]|uniref:Class I SAM-dependent methyltransferase n=1 Tax=Clostridium muellerianum TaxID=2716538 RepID=A0A7Y0HQN1_9CLOT|nr:class I SAM-dependent methyltransferase [Clostridium muellerianum]NMM64336.1 class I SAM-dependent methyltransferase [Clostridium muellerianum]